MNLTPSDLFLGFQRLHLFLGPCFHLSARILLLLLLLLELRVNPPVWNHC